MGWVPAHAFRTLDGALQLEVVKHLVETLHIRLTRNSREPGATHTPAHRAVQTRLAVASQALTAQAHTLQVDVPLCSTCLTRLTLSPLPMHINGTGDNDSKFCTSTVCRPAMPIMRLKCLLRECACYALVDELIACACAERSALAMKQRGDIYGRARDFGHEHIRPRVCDWNTALSTF